MPRYTMVVYTNAAEGQDDEFNAWYNDVHLGDVLSLPGFIAAQRFRLADADPEQQSPHRYLALYELEAESVEAAGKILADASVSGAMRMSDSFDRDTAKVAYFEAITERRSS